MSKRGFPRVHCKESSSQSLHFQRAGILVISHVSARALHLDFTQRSSVMGRYTAPGRDFGCFAACTTAWDNGHRTTTQRTKSSCQGRGRNTFFGHRTPELGCICQTWPAGRLAQVMPGQTALVHSSLELITESALIEASRLVGVIFY